MNAQALTAPHPKYMSADSLLSFLLTEYDWKMSKSYLYKLTCKKEIPYKKAPQGRILFETEKIRQWVMAQLENYEVEGSRNDR